MTEYLTITIQGPPIAKQRARTVIRGKYVHTYDPQAEIKNRLKFVIKCDLERNHKELVGRLTSSQNIAIEAHFRFFLPYPKECNQWIDEASMTKIDLDNLEKFYGDVLSGLVYLDDKQIIALSSEKSYSLQPRTEISIMEKKSPNLDDKTNKILSLFTRADLYELRECLGEVNDLFDLSNPDPNSTSWAQDAVQSLANLAQKFAKKLAQIKRIDDKK